MLLKLKENSQDTLPFHVTEVDNTTQEYLCQELTRVLQQ